MGFNTGYNTQFFKVEDLTEEVLGEIKELYHQLVTYEKPLSTESDNIVTTLDKHWDRIVRNIDLTYLVRTNATNELVAFMNIADDDDAVNITALFVKEEHRRNYLANHMMVRTLMKRPGRDFRVRCFDLNEVALAFYRRNNFTFEKVDTLAMKGMLQGERKHGIFA